MSEEKETSYDFDDEFQLKILSLIFRDFSFAQKTSGLIIPDYMEKEVDSCLMSIGTEYFSKYTAVPDKRIIPSLIKDAITNKHIRSDMIDEIKERVGEILKCDVSNPDYVADKVISFARHRALEKAILSSVEFLQKGDYERISKLINEANTVGSNEVGTNYDYFENIGKRTDHRKDLLAGVIKPNGITTGYEEIDKYLYHHGWGRKELSCIMGPAKAGKSMSLGDFGKNAALAGFNVIYVTLEVSKEIISDRLDANISDTAIRLLKDKPFAVKEAVEKAHKRAGKFVIEEFPSGTLKPSQLKRLLERYRLSGTTFDLIIVDYADIMAPDRFSNEMREDSRLIWLFLRALATEYNAAVLTATQTNREGAKSVIAKATDVAEDFNKVRTVDLMISINALQEEIKSGEARLYFAATRNGEGAFTLRIKQERDKMKFLTKVLGRE